MKEEGSIDEFPSGTDWLKERRLEEVAPDRGGDSEEREWIQEDANREVFDQQAYYDWNLGIYMGVFCCINVKLYSLVPYEIKFFFCIFISARDQVFKQNNTQYVSGSLHQQLQVSGIWINLKLFFDDTKVVGSFSPDTLLIRTLVGGENKGEQWDYCSNCPSQFTAQHPGSTFTLYIILLVN